MLLLALASLAAARGGASDDDAAGRPPDRPAAPAWTGLPRNWRAGDDDAGLPPNVRLPRHGTVVLFSDFLSPLEDIRAHDRPLRRVPVTGYLMQILDPAETALPYHGRVRFRGTGA